MLEEVDVVVAALEEEGVAVVSKVPVLEDVDGLVIVVEIGISLVVEEIEDGTVELCVDNGVD